MIASLDRADVERFRTIIASRLGLRFDESRTDFLAEVLRSRLGGVTAAHYLQRLASNASEELRGLAPHLTVSETYFFRDSNQFRALAEIVLPQRLGTARSGVPVRMLSAGCASGEEPCSLAIALREHFPECEQWDRDAKIRGIDLNSTMIEKARLGRFSPWALRETPSKIQEKYFRKDGREYVLDASIREMVLFEELNLAETDRTFWVGEFDVIFCRNVIMYMVPEQMELVVERLTRALKPGGFLFLGHAETLRGLSHSFHLRHDVDTFYYQKRDDADVRQQLVPEPDVPDAADSWVAAIQTASERIRNLARDCGRQPSPPRPGALDPATGALDEALDLLRQERFREALDTVGRLPPDIASTADARLLRAVLLTNCGDVERAEEVCAELLAENGRNAGACYLRALCREHAGDRQGAVEQDRLAIHLDPSFAIPHLHLGLLAQRSGDMVTAYHELLQAVTLLLREDDLRILLLGGGFSREALLEFSRAQLQTCEGSL